MTNKHLISRHVSYKETFMPLMIGLIFIILMLIIGEIDITISILIISFCLILIFWTRHNAVRMYLFDDKIKIEFYLINKTILIGYDEILNVLSLWDSGIGANLKFIIKHDNIIYKFRVKFLDKEFVEFLEFKMGRKIS